MKRLALSITAACTAVPFVLVLAVTVALVSTPPPVARGVSAIEGVSPAVLTFVSAATQVALGQHPGCDADPVLVIAHMSIEWPPGLQGLGRDNTTMAANGDFAPIIQAYAPVPGPDTDNGHYDGSATDEYAAGPLQQINAFRTTYGTDANNDGHIDQNNLADATATEITHACATRQQSGLSLQTPEGRRYEAGHYMLPAAPTSPPTVDYAESVEAAYQRLRSLATNQGHVRLAGTHAFPLDPALITDEAALLAPHHDYPAWDFPVPIGTTVYAAAGGTVITAGPMGDCGNGVTIDADDGARYTYCHGTEVLVASGTYLAAGEPIMVTGSTGASTGPHLHLQIWLADAGLSCPQALLVDWYSGVDTAPTNVVPTMECADSTPDRGN